MIDLTAIQAKSDQMNAVDFSHSIIFKVSKVEYFPNSKEQPVWIHFEGYEGRPYKPCKGMLRGLTRNDAWTMDEQSWVGKMMELYCDPSVKWGGKESGGIRISGLSSIKSNIKFPVQLNRTQRALHEFRKLEEEAKQEFIFNHWESRINEAASDNAITDVLKECSKTFGKDITMQLKDAATIARGKFNG